jgi:phospholipase/lecithinase/hemolysin
LFFMQQIQDTGQQLKLIVIKLDIRNPIHNKFLIWDDYHPTTVAHQIIADTALAAIEAKSVTKPPTQVGTLLAVGTFGAVGVLKRQQKRSALTTADLVSSAQSSHTVDKKYY